jgi:hypothetical protein
VGPNSNPSQTRDREKASSGLPSYLEKEGEDESGTFGSLIPRHAGVPGTTTMTLQGAVVPFQTRLNQISKNVSVDLGEAM